MTDLSERILEVEDLHVTFEGADGLIEAVGGVSFTIRSGQRLGVVGESGSGKSVTSLSVLQLLRNRSNASTSGQVWFTSRKSRFDLITAPEKQLYNVRGQQIAMIFQEPMSALNPVIRCGKQVSEVFLVHDLVPRPEWQERVLHLFRLVALDDPERVYRSYPHELSGGQLQRVNIAMALAGNPDVLICDEPTTALDVTIQKEIITLLRSLSEKKKLALLFVSHDLDVVSELCDSVVVMYRGQIVEAGPLPEVFDNPTHLYTKALIRCKPRFDNRNHLLPTVPEILEGTYRRTQRRTNNLDGRGEILRVKDISVRFAMGSKSLFQAPKYVQAVDSVSFKMNHGEVLGIVGESGSGKTTVANCLSGLISPSSGSISYKGRKITQAVFRQDKGLRRKIQLIFQDPYSSLNPRMTIGKALEEPIRYHGLAKGHRAVEARVVALLEDVGLGKEYLSRYPFELSGGQRQRVSIARALSVEPDLLICDESVSALDVSVQAQILNLLESLKFEKGISMIFISHDLSVVYYLCDRIIVMKEGRIVESGTPFEIVNQPQKDYTRKLIESIPGS